MLRSIRYLFFVFFGWQSSCLFAQSDSLSACDMPSNHCLLWVNKALINVQPNTMQWYNLKLMQLDSLLTVKEFARLKQVLSQLNEFDNLPLMFSTQLNIYRAKLHRVDGNEAQAKRLLTLSLKDLQQLNQAFNRPMWMIDIANLMLDLKQYTQALDLLEQIKTDFKHSRDVYLKLELYGNLGHANRLIANYASALIHYKESLKFAIELGVEQQIATLYTHIGKMYQATEKMELAEASFRQALTHAQKDAQATTINQAKVTLAYFYIEQLDLDKAQTLIQDIDASDIEFHQHKKWQTIHTALSQLNR